MPSKGWRHAAEQPANVVVVIAHLSERSRDQRAVSSTEYIENDVPEWRLLGFKNAKEYKYAEAKNVVYNAPPPSTTPYRWAQRHRRLDAQVAKEICPRLTLSGSLTLTFLVAYNEAKNPVTALHYRLTAATLLGVAPNSTTMNTVCLLAQCEVFMALESFLTIQIATARERAIAVTLALALLDAALTEEESAPLRLSDRARADRTHRRQRVNLSARAFASGSEAGDGAPASGTVFAAPPAA